MATDKSEPRIGIIFRVGFLTVVTLIAVHTALNAYFDQMAGAEEQRKIGSTVPTALNNLRADELKRLNEGPMPIEKAMQDMAAKGRKDVSPDIAPSASHDLGPLQGWQKMPAEVPVQMTEAPPAAAAADAGAPDAAPSDAGTRGPAPTNAPKKPLKKNP